MQATVGTPMLCAASITVTFQKILKEISAYTLYNIFAKVSSRFICSYHKNIFTFLLQMSIDSTFLNMIIFIKDNLGRRAYLRRISKWHFVVIVVTREKVEVFV